ncbi:SseB family protein [Weissella confusa]|uniref:SseB family protein n=1 Tax=Weissella confusa TaxID=1583 RepID=A0A923SMU2_WEICO|nr:SseB family protein [Weissella confusa]
MAPPIGVVAVGLRLNELSRLNEELETFRSKTERRIDRYARQPVRDDGRYLVLYTDLAKSRAGHREPNTMQVQMPFVLQKLGNAKNLAGIILNPGTDDVVLPKALLAELNRKIKQYLKQQTVRGQVRDLRVFARALTDVTLLVPVAVSDSDRRTSSSGYTYVIGTPDVQRQQGYRDPMGALA